MPSADFRASTRLVSSQVNPSPEHYRAFVQPWVKVWANPGFAEWMRKMHPLRLPYEMFTPDNPFLKFIPTMAESARKNRQAVPPDNAFWQAQERIGNAIETALIEPLSDDDDVKRGLRDLVVAVMG